MNEPRANGTFKLVCAALGVMGLAVGCTQQDGTTTPTGTEPDARFWNQVTIDSLLVVRPDVTCVGQVDEDGSLDAAVFLGREGTREPALFVYFQNNPNDWLTTPIASGDAFDNTSGIALGTVNSDARMDIVAASDGQVNYLPGPETPRSPASWDSFGIDASTGGGIVHYSDVAIGQIDGVDGLDIVASADNPGQILLLRAPSDPNDGTGWTGQIIESDVSRVVAVALVDMDGDGDLDIVATRPDAAVATIAWYEHPGGDATGTWTRHTIGNVADPTRLALGDLNGNGRTDVVVITPGTARVVWYVQPEDLATAWSGFVLAQYGAAGPTDVRVAMVNTDDQPDVVVSTVSPATLRWFTPGDDVQAQWMENNLADLTGTLGRFGAGDVDSDGRPDVVLGIVQPDQQSWFENPF